MTSLLARICSLWSQRLALAGGAVALIVSASGANAQATGIVRGTVTESATGSGLSDVQVFAVGSRRGGVTNRAGRYVITGVPAGRVTVRTQKLGYAPAQPTLVMVAACATVRALWTEPGPKLAAIPDAGWSSVFAGPGFDAAEGAARARALSRAKDAIYASIDDQGSTAAIGTASFGFGWASVHGMRTITHARGRGFASRILAALAGAALERGCARMFLQVEESNAARRLYERAGFATAWRYRYWRR